MKKMTLGEIVRSAREAQGLSLRDVERLCDGEISNPYISQIEHGLMLAPHPFKLIALGFALKIRIRDLYDAAGYLPKKGF